MDFKNALNVLMEVWKYVTQNCLCQKMVLALKRGMLKWTCLVYIYRIVSSARLKSVLHQSRGGNWLEKTWGILGVQH